MKSIVAKSKQLGMSVVAFLIALGVFSIFLLIIVGLFTNFFKGSKISDQNSDAVAITKMISDNLDCCDTIDHIGDTVSTMTCDAINSQSAPYAYQHPDYDDEAGPTTRNARLFGIRALRGNGQPVGSLRDTGVLGEIEDYGWYMGNWNFWVQCHGLLATETGGPTTRHFKILLSTFEKDPTNKADRSIPTEYVPDAKLCTNVMANREYYCTNLGNYTGAWSKGGGGSSSGSTTTSSSSSTGKTSSTSSSSTSSSDSDSGGTDHSSLLPAECDPTIRPDPTKCFIGKDFVQVEGTYYFANSGTCDGSFTDCGACTNLTSNFGNSAANCLAGDLWCPDDGGKVYNIADCAANCSVACQACSNTDTPLCYCSLSPANTGTRWFFCSDHPQPHHYTTIICGMEDTYLFGNCKKAGSSCHYCVR